MPIQYQPYQGNNAMRCGRYRLIPCAILLGAFATSPAQAADASAGEKVFKSQCSICHSTQPGRNATGPTLFGVVGRPTGRVDGFHYSEANIRSHLTWDKPTLDKYLAAPKAVVPGTIMPYPGLKDDDKRADLIAYLATLH